MIKLCRVLKALAYQKNYGVQAMFNKFVNLTLTIIKGITVSPKSNYVLGIGITK